MYSHIPFIFIIRVHVEIASHFIVGFTLLPGRTSFNYAELKTVSRARASKEKHFFKAKNSTDESSEKVKHMFRFEWRELLL